MKKLVLLLFIGIGTFTAKAQDDLVWHTDIKEATTLSQKENKPLMLFFTGSDWCGWCMKLQREVLKTPEFEAWAKEHVILVELDYPKRKPQELELKKQNQQLMAFFKVRGYPTVWFTNATLKEDSGQISFDALGSTGYVAGGPSAWLETANKILDYRKDKKEVKNTQGSK